MSKIMSKGDMQLGSKSTSVKTKEPSVLSKKSRSGSYLSTHGSRFGRSVCRFPKQNDPETALTLSTSNSRVIPALFDFKTEHGSNFPDLTVTEATESIRHLGKALNILDYEFNYASFWALDILSQNLAELQLDSCSVENQKLFLGWFSYVLRCISISGAAREDVFMLLQGLFKNAVNIIEAGGDIPYPGDINIDSTDNIHPKLSTEFKGIISSISNGSVGSKQKPSSKKSSKKSISLKSIKRSLGSSSKKSSKGSMISISSEDQLKLKLNVFYKIIGILYKIFADRFMYSVIRLAYSSPAITVPVDIPFEFNEIKQKKPEPVIIPSVREKSPKGKKSVSKERKKSKEKGKKKKSPVEGKNKKSKSSLDGDKEKRPKKGSKGNSKATPEAPTEYASNGHKKKGKERKSRSKSNVSTDAATEDESTKKKGSKRKMSKSKKGSSTTGKQDDKEVDNMDDKSSKRKSINSKKGGRVKKRSKSEGVEMNNSYKKEIKTKDTKKGKKGRKSRSTSINNSKKGKTSTMDSVSLRESGVNNILQARMKLFERSESPKMQPEEEKVQSINQFILPLSEAVDEKFVENLIKTLLPAEPEREEDNEAKVDSNKNKRKGSKTTKKSSVRSKKSSVKAGKSKKGKNKK